MNPNYPNNPWQPQEAWQPPPPPQQPWAPQPPPQQQWGPPAQRQPESGGPQSLLELFKVLAPAVLKGILRSLPLTIVMGLAILALNTYIVVVKNDGFEKWSSDLPWWMAYIISRSGTKAGATLFWAFTGTMASMLFSRLISGSLFQTFRNFLKTPSFISQARQEATGSLGVQLLAGAGMAWLVGSVAQNPLVCLQCTIMSLGAVTRRQQSLLMTILRLGHKDTQRWLKQPEPHKLLPYGELAFIVVGLAGGFVTALVMPKLLGATFGYLIAIVLLGTAFALSLNRDKARTFSVFLFLALYLGLMICPVLAHDGGWSENGNSFSTWATSGGAPIAIGMGLGPVIGLGVGIGLGPIIGSGLSGLWSDLPVDLPPDMPPVAPPPPQVPQDIEWTSPDGVNQVLTWSAENNAYINILTGGLVDPNNIEGWKQNIAQNLQQVDAWRTHNQQLEAAGLDAQHQALAAIQADAANRTKILANLSHMEQKILFGNGADDLLKAPGEPGDILKNIDKLADDIASGKDIDHGKLAAIGKYYGDTVSGKILPPDQMPQPGDEDKGVLAQTLENTFKEVSTCTNENGTSWKGLAARTGLAILTGGFSEIPMALGAMQEYVDKGGNSVLGGFVAGAAPILVGEAMGAGLGLVAKGLAAGGKVAGELATEAGEAISQAAAGGNTLAQGLVKGASALSDAAGSVSTNILKPIANVLGDVQNVLTTDIRFPGSSVEGAGADALGAGVSKVEGATVAGADTEGAVAGVSKGEGAAAADTESATAAAGKSEGAATAPTGKQNYTYANSPGEDIAPHMTGMPDESISQAQRIAEENNAQILVRPTTPHAAEKLASGEALPKPCYVKNKTISELDIQLGAKSEDIGLVGHFEPKLPEQGSMTNEEYSELVNRFNQRQEEYIKQNIVLKNNPDVEIKGGVVFDKATGKPFTGDHDIFDIVGADGKPLPPDVKAKIMTELKQPPFGAQHDAHIDWKYDDLNHNVPAGEPEGTISDFQQAQNIDTKILGSHGVGGEPLISFGPNRAPQASYFVGRR